MTVRDDIERHASEDDKPILLWLLGRYSLESQWRFVAAMKRKRYGVYSYHVHRVWSPTREGRILYENREIL